MSETNTDDLSRSSFFSKIFAYIEKKQYLCSGINGNFAEINVFIRRRNAYIKQLIYRITKIKDTENGKNLSMAE